MAKEQLQEITEEGGGGIGAMIPAIAVLVLMPLVSFAITKFVFIPQIQAAVLEVSDPDAVAAHAADDHGKKPAKKDDGHGGGGKGDGHGGGYGDEAAADDGTTGYTYEFESIVANLSGGSLNRYVKVSFIVEGGTNDFASVIETNRVKIIDSTITVLSSLTSLDLQDPGVKNSVRSKLMASFDAVLKQRIVTGLYFSEFVVQ